ncbi:MAG: LytTR family transcriptional regulator [Rikenellaceae bacterium]|nr:LytTR family transcriptional regulator [Rikenellaceae bacterium]MBO7168757.1 LytTR family transcriptional regulator [Rikenellaceae bacterium]
MAILKKKRSFATEKQVVEQQINAMDWLTKPIPAFMYRKGNQIAMCVFAALFALVFINTYNPFGAEMYSATYMSDNLHFGKASPRFLFVLFTSIVVLIGFAIVLISRVVMHQYLKRNTLSAYAYIIWVLCEVVAMSLVYTVMTLLGKMQDDVWEAFTNSLLNTTLVLIIPYALCLTFFALQEKNRQIKRLAGIRNERATAQGLVSFYDERGELRLSVRHDHLLLLEAADNYVCVWYMSYDEPKKVMVRNSLKRLSQQLDGTGIVRCHRSYMVNIDQVKVVRREKDGAMLDLGIDGIPSIPISQTYNESVTHWLTLGSDPDAE